MKVHRISLRNYRGVSESDVSFADTGVTIVEGANEVGKTSLAEALRLVLDERDSSSKARVRSVLPVGRDTGAEVEVELSTGPYRFVYRKRWGRRPETVLDLAAPTRRQLTGRDAHDRVRAILDETLDVDLFAALHLEQGGGSLQADFSMRSLGQALDLAASGERAGEREDALWDRIVAERDRYWTATGRHRPERTAVAERVAHAAAEVSSLEERLGALDEQAEHMARLDAEARTLAARQVELERHAGDLTRRAGRVDALRAEVGRLASRHEAAAAASGHQRHLHDHRRELVGRVTASEELLADSVRHHQQATPMRDAAERHHAETVLAQRQAIEALRDAEDRHRVAGGDADHRRHEIEVEQLTERRDRVLVEQVNLDAAARVIEATSVDEAQVAAIEAAHLDLLGAEAAVAAAGATVAVTALTATEVHLGEQVHVLAEGDDVGLALSSAPGTHLVIPGVVSLTVRPGAEGQARVGRAATAADELARLCQDASVADLDDARRQAAARAQALREHDQAVRAIRENLRDLTVDALAQKVDRLAGRVATYHHERSGEAPEPADLDAAQEVLRAADVDLRQARDRWERLDGEAVRAARDLNQTKVDDAGLAAQVNHARVALETDARRLAVEREEASDEEVAALLEEAEGERSAAAAALGRAQAELAGEDPNALDALVANARAAEVRGADAIGTNRDQRRQLQVRLEVHGEEGLARQRDEAVTRHQRLAGELARLDAHAQAARLLYDSFAARRSQARNRYVGPFRSRIEQLGRLVFGPDLVVDLGADLRITRRTLAGVTVDFDQLSTGAREQLALLARLACASIVAGPEGAPVVFDDALGWTDPARLAQMGAAIAMAGRDCQIIVLTSTPDRYAAVGNATVVRLPTDTSLPAVASA